MKISGRRVSIPSFLYPLDFGTSLGSGCSIFLVIANWSVGLWPIFAMPPKKKGVPPEAADPRGPVKEEVADKNENPPSSGAQAEASSQSSHSSETLIHQRLASIRATRAATTRPVHVDEEDGNGDGEENTKADQKKIQVCPVCGKEASEDRCDK